MRLFILLQAALPAVLALCQNHPCGSGCIPADKICCSPVDPYTTPFACPLDYTCGPGLECRPPSPAAGPVETGVPLCGPPFVACGATCTAPDSVCCEDGAWSCAAGLECAPAPLQCVAPLAQPSPPSSSRSLTSQEGLVQPTTVADVTMPGGYGTVDASQASEPVASTSSTNVAFTSMFDGTKTTSTDGLAYPVPTPESSASPGYSVYHSTVTTLDSSSIHGSAASSLVEDTSALSSVSPSQSGSADEGTGGRVEVPVGATLMGVLLGAVLLG
ncbi:hypothetical protein VD0002_g6010 [Verticillium dahliae]|uniref:GPI anchored serine-threonine rich protein n=2 Tax=Verticillium dahliae TaxID=27337 RepID=G2X6K9_VERDV|nr:uncharacterized protein VDAG_05791 [Verticillium dahliae VdLs.17]KAF3345798.1 hypothetical protein VdG2_06034 [Verticillium dahliae VDG2]KAH6708322.1 hypothetical protein EV126DRAFT_376800 [Verticillium dahliae]EGY14627.1 hypothetical protein VDAG_05791 [Verticillium dahliae VdLs.17]PNH35011.1 hypothetical protein BJF96_g1778 [Verticillium dahliae]PNH46269.1 hypothetical protein VD0004_g1833 [Verticillium dahliae]